MAFKNLLLLKEKEYRLYLILIIWLIIGFTLFQFEVLYIAGLIVFIPLMALSYILFLTSLVSYKKKLRDMSRKRLIITIIILTILVLLFFNFFFFLFIIFLYLAIISYILITSIFTMLYFFNLGIKIDDYLYKLPTSLKKFERWCFFVGGILVSIISLIVAIIITESITGGTQEAIGFNTAGVAIIIIIIIVIFGIIGAIHSLQGRLYAWMGIFFVWVAIYTIYLMGSIIYRRISEGGATASSIPLQILLYFFNLFILLNTIGSLIAEKTDILKAKLRIFGPDTVLMWLIFSITIITFLSGLETAEIDIFRLIAVFILFIPLLIFMTIYGIRNYGNVTKERKIKQLEKEAKKEGVIEKEQILCRECGAVNSESDKFCLQCGVELN